MANAGLASSWLICFPLWVLVIVLARISEARREGEVCGHAAEDGVQEVLFPQTFEERSTCDGVLHLLPDLRDGGDRVREVTDIAYTSSYLAAWRSASAYEEAQIALSHAPMPK